MLPGAPDSSQQSMPPPCPVATFPGWCHGGVSGWNSRRQRARLALPFDTPTPRAPRRSSMHCWCFLPESRVVACAQRGRPWPPGPCSFSSGLLTSPLPASKVPRADGFQSWAQGWFSCPNLVGSKVGWRRGCGYLSFQGCLSSAPHPLRTHVHAPHTHARVRSHMHSRTPACTPMMLPQKASKSGPSLSSRNSDESGRRCVFMPARGLFPPPNQK